MGNGFTNSLKNSMVKDSKNLFITGGTYQTRGEYMENKVQKQSTHSELHFLFCFILILCLEVKTQMWRHYCLNTINN